MRRVFLPAGIAALCVLGPLATGCKEQGRPPFHSPSRTMVGRDAGPVTDAENGPLPRLPVAGGCESGPEMRALFIGNSHTYRNEVPALVSRLACEAGTRLVVETAAEGGVGFVEHATRAQTLAAIEAQAWDFVVLQDQQQRPGYRLDEIERDHLPAARMLVEAARLHHAEVQPVFYLTWARKGGDSQNCEYYPRVCTFEGHTRAVSEGYGLHAERNDAQLAPVALAWAAVRADDDAPLSADALWADDGSHSALPGAYLAAAVITGSLLDVETASLPVDAGLEAPVAEYLRRVADEVIRRHRADPRIATNERVALSCDFFAGCRATADAASVTFTLSTDGCDALSTGAAEAVGRLHTTASCRGECTTVLLGGWHEVRGETIDDGAYQVHVHVDINDNGRLDEGDLESCEDGFEVGSGTDLTFTELTARP